jgi:acyl-coenzyme A thioesterase PaaI-like protein
VSDLESRTPPAGFEPLPSRSVFINRSGLFFVRREPDGTQTVGTWIGDEQSNSEGFAHGGFLLTFADFALTMTTTSITLSLTADFMRPTRTDRWVQAQIFVRKRSDSLLFADAIVTDGSVELVRVSALLRPRIPDAQVAK